MNRVVFLGILHILTMEMSRTLAEISFLNPSSKDNYTLFGVVLASKLLAVM